MTKKSGRETEAEGNGTEKKAYRKLGGFGDNKKLKKRKVIVFQT